MIGLGLRLSIGGGRDGWTRLLAIGAGVMVGVVLMLSAVSALRLSGQRSNTPCWRCTETIMLPDDISTLPSNSLVWTQGMTIYNGEYINQVQVAPSGQGAPVIPGIDRAVQPGEYFASPALAKLIRDTPASQLSDRFPGRLAGEIGTQGLRSPSELLVVIGRQPAELFSNSSAGYVTELQTTPLEVYRDPWVVAMFLLVVGGLLFAILSLIVAATRLGAARREERFATLRLFGATPRQISLIAVIDAAFAALIGVAMGGLTFLLIRPLLASLFANAVDAWPEQFAPSAAGIAIVCAGTLLVSMIAALLSLRRVIISPLGVVRKSTPKPPGIWRLLPLVAGFAALILVWVTNRGVTDTIAMAHATPIFLVGFGLVLLGIALAGPWLTQYLARLFARLAMGAPSLLAARRLADNPKAAFRSVAVLVVAAFLATMVTTFAPILRLDMSAETENQLSVQYAYFLDNDAVKKGGIRLADVEPLLRELGNIPGLVIVPWHLKTVESPNDIFGRDIYARCSDIRLAEKPNFAATSLCDSAAPNAVVHVSGGEQGPEFRYESKPDENAQITTEDISSFPLHSFEMILPPSQRVVERLRTLFAQTPETSNQGVWSTPAEVRAGTERVAQNIELAINSVLLLILFVAGCSLAVSAGGAIVERKRPFGLLRVSGMSIKQLRRVVLYESVIPLLASVAIAGALGFIVAVLFIQSFVGATERVIEPPTLIFYGAMGLGICLALTAILATMPLLNAVTKPDKARFE